MLGSAGDTELAATLPALSSWGSQSSGGNRLILQKTGPRLGRTGRGEPRRQGDPRAGVRLSLEGEIKEGFLEEVTFALRYKGKINTSHKEQG